LDQEIRDLEAIH
jgi:hypothetical protein